VKVRHCDLCDPATPIGRRRWASGGDWCPCHAGFKRPTWQQRAERLRIRILDGRAKAIALAGWRRV
jgi:hypothetical protein